MGLRIKDSISRRELWLWRGQFWARDHLPSASSLARLGRKSRVGRGERSCALRSRKELASHPTTLQQPQHRFCGEAFLCMDVTEMFPFLVIELRRIMIVRYEVFT